MKRKIFTLIELLIRKICKKNITQRISLNLNSEFCPDENVFQDLAERVPHHDFVSDVEICGNSRPGTVSPRRRNQSLCLSSFFFLLPSIVQMFSCSIVRLFPRSFFLPCFLFDILTSQGENKSFHLDRAADRNCDHCDSCGNAAAGFEQGEEKGTDDPVYK